MNEKPKSVQFDLPEGARMTAFEGRFIVAGPDTHPYFLDVDWNAPNGPVVVKTPICPAPTETAA